MNDAWSIMDIVVMVCGVYALYAAYVLKTKGKIIKTFLVFKETDVNTCKDLGAYAASMAPKLSTLAGVMILYGVVSLINTYVISIMSLYWVMMVALIGTLIWYGIQTRNANISKRIFDIDFFLTRWDNMRGGKCLISCIATKKRISCC